jgi:hypothetical protein
MAQKLVEDLAHINKLIGPMKPTADFISRWEKWQPEFDQSLIDLNSERLEAITSRKGTNLIKVAMLLSISEGDSLSVTGDHFDRALDLIEDAYKDNPKIIALAAMADMESQKGLTQFIMRFMEKNGGTLPKSAIMSAVMSNGNDTTYMDGVLQNMILSGWIHYTADNHFKIGTNPDDHL